MRFQKKTCQLWPQYDRMIERRRSTILTHACQLAGIAGYIWGRLATHFESIFVMNVVSTLSWPFKLPLLIGRRKAQWWQITTATQQSNQIKSNDKTDRGCACAWYVWILMCAFNFINGNMCRRYSSGLFYRCDNYQFRCYQPTYANGFHSPHASK